LQLTFKTTVIQPPNSCNSRSICIQFAINV